MSSLRDILQWTVCMLSVAIIFAGLHDCCTALPQQAAERPYIFGSGYIFGSWKSAYTTVSEQSRWDIQSLTMIKEMGATVTGVSFNWCDIERVRGVYNWTATDRMVNMTLQAGLVPFAYSGNTPDWALLPNQTGLGYRFPAQPQFADDFTAFFVALAQHYNGRVVHYEFWNEQNGCSWINDGCSNGNMAPTYAPWLCRWYAAMKSGSPNVVLSVGGLDYHLGVTDGYAKRHVCPKYLMYKYIEDLYAANASHCFDAVALHPYGDTTPGNELNWKALNDTYQVLVNHDESEKQLWVNEWGWNTDDETAKAKAVTVVLSALQTTYTQVFMASYLCLTDLPGTPDDHDGYGLCSQNTPQFDITPRLSYVAFQNFDKHYTVGRPDDDAMYSSRPSGVQSSKFQTGENRSSAR